MIVVECSAPAARAALCCMAGGIIAAMIVTARREICRSDHLSQWKVGMQLGSALELWPFDLAKGPTMLT